MEDRMPDFSGWATRHGVECSDGRIISDQAFAHNDNQEVPIMWQHGHNDVTNVLGRARLQHRQEGVYALGFFNETEQGKVAKELVRNRDINSLSIYANNLRHQGVTVTHGDIKEVSLVISGANPEAFIDYVSLSHGEDGDEAAVIFSGEYLAHEEDKDTNVAEENEDPTVEDVLGGMTETQLAVVEYLVGEAIETALSDTEDDDEVEHDFVTNEEDILAHLDGPKEGNAQMAHNVFDQTSPSGHAPTLSHSQLKTIFADAQRTGSIKEAFLAHAQEYGIENIDFLFPEAKNLTDSPQFVKRRTEWVAGVLNGVKKSPFSRVKTVLADITAEEARARGYVKNTMKKEEVIKLLKRTTTPTTVYKKQKLDRDDIIDITDLDVVAWLKAEMRVMLDEEIARAILIGDGRSSLDEDHIKDPAGATSGEGIRSILYDHEMYAHKVTVNASLTPGNIVEAILRARTHYDGATPTFFTTDAVINDMLLEKDKIGRRIYKTEAELASAIRVKEIVPVEVMKYHPTLLGIMVNLTDYTVGADKGGQVSFFDDFDIDFNQYRYLMEGRMSGGLTKPKSAIVFSRTDADQVVPTMPGFDTDDNEITIPTVTGVDYMIDDEVVTGTVVISENTTVEAHPQEGYVFPQNITTSWTFTYVD